MPWWYLTFSKIAPGDLSGTNWLALIQKKLCIKVSCDVTGDTVEWHRASRQTLWSGWDTGASNSNPGIRCSGKSQLPLPHIWHPAHLALQKLVDSKWPLAPQQVKTTTKLQLTFHWSKQVLWLDIVVFLTESTSKTVKLTIGCNSNKKKWMKIPTTKRYKLWHPRGWSIAYDLVAQPSLSIPKGIKMQIW